MYPVAAVFDTYTDSIIDFWYGRTLAECLAKLEEFRMKYIEPTDATRYDFTVEYQGTASNYSHAAGYPN